MTWDRKSVPSGLTALIKIFEGYSSKPYDDAGPRGGGTWTIGYGSTRGLDGKPITPHTPEITEDQALQLMQRDLQSFIDNLNQDVPDPLEEHQAAALLCLSYNLGRLRAAAPTLLSVIKTGTAVDVANQFRVYRNSGGKPVLGLRRRRYVEAAMWMGMDPWQAKTDAWTKINTPDQWISFSPAQEAPAAVPFEEAAAVLLEDSRPDPRPDLTAEILNAMNGGISPPTTSTPENSNESRGPTMSDDWRSVVQAVAPTVATFLGGPLAGMAATVIGRAVLGRGESTPTSVPEAQQAIAEAAMTPEGLVKLREAEARIIELRNNLQIELGKQALDNTRNARDREIKLGDKISGRLATVTVTLFFIVVAIMLYGVYLVMSNQVSIPDTNREIQLAAATLVGVMFQQLASMVKDIYGYYFGGSLGSSQKNDTIAAAVTSLSGQQNGNR